jgi:hypothetical protein
MAGSEEFMHFDEVLAGKSGFKFNRCFGLDYVSRFHGLVAASNSARLRLRIVICESAWKQEWFWTPITYLPLWFFYFFFILYNLGYSCQRSIDTRTSTNPKEHAIPY